MRRVVRFREGDDFPNRPAHVDICMIPPCRTEVPTDRPEGSSAELSWTACQPPWGNPDLGIARGWLDPAGSFLAYALPVNPRCGTTDRPPPLEDPEEGHARCQRLQRSRGTRLARDRKRMNRSGGLTWAFAYPGCPAVSRCFPGRDGTETGPPGREPPRHSVNSLKSTSTQRWASVRAGHMRG